MKAEKTKEIIAKSFFDLMMQYYFEDITVGMICTEAGIGRSSFYRFFRDKYDVLVVFFEMNYKAIHEKHSEAKDYISLMEDYFRLIKKYDSFFRQALSITGQNSLGEYIHQSGMDYYVQHIEEIEGRKTSREEELSILMFTSGMMALLNEWIQKKFQMDPEIMAQIALDSMPMWMRSYFCED